MSSAQAADGGQHVLDLEGHAAAVGQRDRGHVGQAFLARALRQHDGAVAHEHGAAILLQVGGDGGQGGVDAEEDHGAVGQLGHFDHARIARVQHRVAAGQHHVHLRAEDAEHAFGVIDVEIAEVVGVVDVGDHADLAAVVGQALAQDHAAVVLDDGGVDVAVHQDARARGEVGAVALLHQAAVQVQALAAGQAGALARQVQQARDQARDHGLAVGAGDADDGDAAGVAFGEQVVDDGPAHGAGRAVGRLQVHQQAGAGVDFDDGAALLVQRPRDVLGHQVHAGDVQADDAGGQRHGRGDAGVDLVGHVERHVAAALHQHALAVGGHAVGVHALAGDLQARGGIQAHRVQRVILGAAAARVGIDLVVDQLGDGGLAVARDPGRLAGGGGPPCGRPRPAGGARCPARSARR